MSAHRIGVIDLGSNSLRLVVFDGLARSPAYFYNEKITCGLGRGLSVSGVLHPEGKEAARAGLLRFAHLAREMQLAHISGVATAAVRAAKDGPSFIEEIRAETGLEIKIISGAEEARLSAMGVRLGWPNADGMVCDIGGASMELARLQGGQISRCRTSPLGPIALLDHESDLQAHLASEITRLTQDLSPPKRLYLVGGSWRALARLHMARCGYPLSILHEYHIAPRDLDETIDALHQGGEAVLDGIDTISSDRKRLLPMAARVLKALLSALTPETLVISSYGLREGVFSEALAPELLTTDPLLESSAWLEAHNARFPGLGERLFAWLMPAFAPLGPSQERLIRAAALLHDICWRVHPDYRARVAFHDAAYANYCGVSHEGRLFLGLALSYRYASAKGGPELEPLFALLPEETALRAEAVGRVLRLGAMLATSGRAVPGRLERSATHLRLIMPQDPGEVALKRLEQFAKTLGLEAELHISS